MKKILVFTFICLASAVQMRGQLSLKDVLITSGNRQITGFDDRLLAAPLPLFSFELDGVKQTTVENGIESRIQTTVEKTALGNGKGFVQYKVIFTNISSDTVELSNVVPMGASPDRMYISGLGEHPLSRARLFTPGRKPVNVILPDDAWEMGYSSLPLPDSLGVYMLARRKTWTGAERKRFSTRLFPKGSVEYALYGEYFRGGWRDGLILAFQKRKLFDLDSFDNSMFLRPDLKWIRHAYTMHLVMAWDAWMYDAGKGDYTIMDFIRQGKKLYGGDDAIGVWPTWPTLGLDDRNQWDLFQDLPGGLSRLRRLAQDCAKEGVKLFICYNPWDESTEGSGAGKNHLGGLSRIIEATGADGVVLDTRGASSAALQAAADSVKKGVVMYSEGMAVPRDMPGIVAGRVHNALYYAPLLNLNKLIKPEFAIFRVAELYKEPIRREILTSFFNGYGTEINIFKNGKPDWLEDQYRLLGKTSMILREHSEVFTQPDIRPLIDCTRDGIFVNQWQTEEKTVYSIFSLIPQGFKGGLFEVDTSSARSHYMDLWRHVEAPIMHDKEGKTFVEVELGAFQESWLGTNNEGAAGCIVRFKKRLSLRPDLEANTLQYSAKGGDRIKIWAGIPSYDKERLTLAAGTGTLDLKSHFSRFEGLLVVQLFQGSELIDEAVVEIPSGTPRLISSVQRPTGSGDNDHKNMVRVPGGAFVWRATHGDDWVNYPEQDTGKTFSIPSFWMDKDLVTNGDYTAFLQSVHYNPADTAHFLKSWGGPKPPKSMLRLPVVHVSYEDACQYCRWLGKRLPAEREWQYAAQYPDGRLYPWGDRMDSLNVNITGKLELAGARPRGANTLGIHDLIGNVWQLTNDVYQNASFRYIMLKGGAYYKPDASWWYVRGGAQPIVYRQILLRVSEGFERNGTVGFRCAQDIK